MRRCIACYTSYPQEDLIRFTIDGNTVVPDIYSKNEGRGVYLCNKKDCYEVAIKKNLFNRAFKMQVDIETNKTLIERLFDSAKED